MKNSLLFAAAAAMVCSASAEVQQLAPRSIEGLNVKQLHAEMAEARKAKAPRAAMAAAPARTSDYITPEGDIKYYSASGYFDSLFGLMYDELATTIALAPDGKTVYFNSLIPAGMTDIWTPGAIEGNTVTINSETVVGNYSGMYDITVGEFVLDEEGNITGWKDLVLAKEGDSYYMEDDDIAPERYAALLAFTDGEFQGYLSYALLLDFEPVDVADPVTLPEGAQPAEYIYQYKTYSGYNVVDKALGYIDGNDMYLNDLTSNYTGGWVKGTIEGNQVTFKPGQLIGITTYFLYFNPFTYEGDDPATLEGVYTPADLVFNIDENGVLTQANPEVYASYSFTPNVEDIYNFSSDYTITPYTEVLFGIPTDPANLFIEDYWDYYGQMYLQYELLNIGTNGNFLEPDNYYYTLYIDDEPYAIGPDNFEYVSEDMVEIPLDYYDDFGGYDIAPGYVYVAENMFETIGIQGIYYYNGQPYYSNIVSVDLEGNIYVTEVENGDPINISTIHSAANNQKVIYNAMGQKINKAERGFNIVNGKKHIIK